MQHSSVHLSLECCYYQKKLNMMSLAAVADSRNLHINKWRQMCYLIGQFKDGVLINGIVVAHPGAQTQVRNIDGSTT